MNLRTTGPHDTVNPAGTSLSAPMRAQQDAEDGCMVSTSWERRCATDDQGKLRCETLQRKWRHCPGRAPEELSSTHSEEGADGAQPHVPPALASPWATAPRGPTDGGFDHMFRQMEAMMGILGGGFFGGGLAMPPRMPQPAAPGQERRPPLRLDEA